MTHVFYDRVAETTTTSGTGTVTLLGAVAGYQPFSVVGNGNTCSYCLVDGTNWEVGLGTYTLSGTLLARTTVYESSNSGSKITLSGGTTQVFLTASAFDVSSYAAYSVPAFTVQDFVAGTGFTAGSSTTITLNATPASSSSLEIYFDGVAQFHNTWSLSGTTVTFTSAIPTTTQNIEAQWVTSAGINSFTGGTASSPAFTVTGSTSTGLYSSAANTMGIASNGSAALTISSAQVVNAPVALQLNGSGVIDKINVQRFTSSGAYTYTPTTGMVYCTIEMVGGGGGSGGTSMSGSQSGVAAAGGGAGGMKLFATAANIGASATGSVGAAGTAGASGNNAGGTGGNTTIVISSSTWTAGGGVGGAGNAGSAGAQNAPAGGAGGTNTTGSNATLLINEAGQAGGGGFSDGGTVIFLFAGGGGSSLLGLGAASAIGNTSAVSGTGYGSGASAAGNGTGSALPGAAGTIGIVIITEYISA